MTAWRTNLHAAVAAVLPIRSSRPGADETVRRVVLVGWLLLAAVPFQFVIRYGVDSPHADEWCMVKPLVGEQPLWPWLWERHNEHLYPLPRLIWWGLFQITGQHFQAGMYLTAWALAAAAWMLLRLVRALRGQARIADLLIPLVLCGECHHETLLSGYNLCFALVAVFTAGFLRAAVGARRPSIRFGVQSGLLTAVALCGGGGLVYSAPLAVALVGTAVRSGRRDGWTVGHALAMASAVAAGGYTAWYVRTMPPRATPLEANPYAARAFAEFLGGSLGAAGPVGAWVWVPTAVVAGVLLLLAVVRCWPITVERGVVQAAVAGAIAVGLSIAASRWSYEGESGLSSRYAVFAAMLVASAWVLAAGRDDRLTRWCGRVALVAAVGVQVFAWPHAETYGAIERYRLRSVAKDAADGADVDAVVNRNMANLLPDNDWTRECVTDSLDAMRRHRIGPFRGLPVR